MLEEFARFLLRRDLSGPDLGLAAVISTSEPLTAPRRAVISEAFGAPVQNEYGCGEVGPIAYECPEEGMLHVMSQNVILEVLDAQGEPVGPGGSGEIVVTDLNNHSMPLIRYAIGDFATVAEACRCGRAFPVLSAIWGRAYDFLEDSAGRRYHGESVMYIFEDLRDRGVKVGRFQIVQDRPGHIVARVVPGSSAASSEATAVEIADTCRGRLGGMTTEVEFVDEIRRARSGKTHLIIRMDRFDVEQSDSPEDSR
jgi:phenylacetate-CoA ligase